MRSAYDVSFLTPSKSTASSSSLQRHIGNGTTRYGSGHGAWAQATIAPASVEVHYHYLAGRYRDLSYERGLDLLNSSAASTSKNSKANEKSLKASEEEQSARHTFQPMARNTSADENATPSKSLDSLFLGSLKSKGRKRMPLPSFDERGCDTKSVASAPHGAKHGSLRRYAEERIKVQEHIEVRIQRATDIGRLKWEAKAAMLNNAYPLAIQLYARAAHLGSLTACLALAKIHCTGITKGKKPIVILSYRDPCLALSWVLEAAAMLRNQFMRKKRRSGEGTENTDDLSQEKQMITLLARLLRCHQMHLTRQEDVRLPLVRSGGDSQGDEEQRLAWHAVCDVMEDMESRLQVAKDAQARQDDEGIGPDDEDGEREDGCQEQIQVKLIQALVATRRWATISKDETGFQLMQTCWATFAASVRKQKRGLSRTFGDLHGILSWCDTLSHYRPEQATHTLNELVGILDGSLVESVVPVASFRPSGTPYAHTLTLESPRKRKAQSKTNTESLSVDQPKPRTILHQRPALLRKASSIIRAPSLIIDQNNAAGKLRPNLERAASFSCLPLLRSRKEDELLRQGERSPSAKKEARRMGRRPSSIMSDSPSLLFTHEEDECISKADTMSGSEHNVERCFASASAASESSSFWRAARPTQARHTHTGSLRKGRVISSMYSNPSIAPSELIHTEGPSTFDYDINTSIRRQQARRERGGSNASISTIASKLSTNPSLSESMAGKEHARGCFMTSSISSDINGFEMRLHGAADSLRRIRKASGMSSESARRGGSTASRLDENLEEMIANSASYRAIQSRQQPSSDETSRKPSNASMRSLTAFTASNHRQGPRGNLACAPLHQGAPFGRAFSLYNGATTLSPALAKSMSFFDASYSNAAVDMNVSSMHVQLVGAGGKGASAGALGSLRMLSKQGKAQNDSKGTTSVSHTTSQQQLFNDQNATQRERAEGSKRAFDISDQTTQHHPSASFSASNILQGDNAIWPLPVSGNSLDPALAEAEERSGLKTTSNCHVCGQKVVNAPMTKSGEVFCGRDCRMKRKRQRANGEKRYER